MWRYAGHTLENKAEMWTSKESEQEWSVPKIGKAGCIRSISQDEGDQYFVMRVGNPPSSDNWSPENKGSNIFS